MIDVWLRIAQKLKKIHEHSPLGQTSDTQDGNPEWFHYTDDLLDAKLLTSLSTDPPGGNWHYPTIDLDVPAVLVPSSTPGHSHLYIDKPVPWDKYVKVLDALADAGIMERGCVEAAKRRGFTTLRTPWTKKQDEADLYVSPEADLQEVLDKIKTRHEHNPGAWF